MTLAEYILKRNGVPAGNPSSLRNNLIRSLGARNFSTFWVYWNPIFGYYLGYGIFKPLKKYLPEYISLIITFFACGLIHDLAAILFIQKTSFLFSIWFLFMGTTVLISRSLNQDFKNQSWGVRALINLLIIGICLFLAYCTKKFIGLEQSFAA